MLFYFLDLFSVRHTDRRQDKFNSMLIRHRHRHHRYRQ
jgi:hypothetical protein